MADEAIFFPYVDVPRNDWSTRVLLYWDRAAAIIPEDLLTEPSLLDDHTRDLIDSGLLHPLRPDYHAVSRAGFAEPFLAIIDSDPEIRARGSVGPSRYQCTRMHIGKLGLGLIEQLRQRGLAGDGQWRDEYWVDVEARTASKFMAYFALFLRNERGRDFDPVTDDFATLSALSEPIASAGAGERWIPPEETRVALLRAALPLPNIPPAAAELATFKEAHGAELVRFRSRIEESVLALARFESPGQQLELLRHEQWELEQELHATRRRIEDLGSGSTMGALAVLIACVSPVVAELPDPSPVSILAAGAGGLASAYLARDVLPGFRPRDPAEPLAYALLAESAFG